MKALVGIFFLLSIQSLSYGLTVSDRSGGRIVGGFEIPLSEAPYQVSVLYLGSHICGGSIISKNFVLTACHCSYKKTASSLSTRVGSRVLGEGGEVIAVLAVLNHPYFNSYSYDYDYAVLRLKTYIIFDGVTKAPIALPALNAPIADDTPVLVSGWGYTKTPSVSNKILRGVIIPTINQSKCSTIYKYDGGISVRMVCAGSAGKDNCNGDSGGAMKSLETNEQIGIVSFGMDCADLKYPGVYSRISVMRSWIRSVSGV